MGKSLSKKLKFFAITGVFLAGISYDLFKDNGFKADINSYSKFKQEGGILHSIEIYPKGINSLFFDVWKLHYTKEFSFVPDLILNKEDEVEGLARKIFEDKIKLFSSNAVIVVNRNIDNFVAWTVEYSK